MSIQASEFDLVTRDKKTIDTQKVILKIWEHRKDARVVADLAVILSKFVDEKRVFGDIEFFLPQIAHLTIHLDSNGCSGPLEQLLVMIAQTSVHAALQLSFIFSAALEDYQPETNGHPNPSCDPILFKRCARLLEDVERAVIYGSSTVTAKEKAILEQRTSPKGSDSLSPRASASNEQLKAMKRQEMASTLARMKSFMDGQLSGDLFYKRLTRKSSFHSKCWKECYFVVDKRVLLCYKDPYSMSPKRTLHLQNCKVKSTEIHPKYGDTVFEVYNEAHNCHFLLRAETPEKKRSWINIIQNEINGAPPVFVTEGTEQVETEDTAANEIKIIPSTPLNEMSPIQRKRFAFFRQMKVFIMNMTNICDRLRTKERPLRKFFLKHDMKELVLPPFVYIPLCSSLDPYCAILKTLPKECHAFTTKARVPALMMFETEQHSQAVDVATFLGSELERYSESEVIQDRLEIVQAFTGTVDENDDFNGNGEGGGRGRGGPVERKPSKFGGFTRGQQESNWVVEGTGLQRCEEEGFRLNLSIGRVMSTSDPAISSPTTTATTTSETIPTQQVVVSVESPLGESFEAKAQRIKTTSPYGHLPHWHLGGLIAKSNDDVRQEVFVIQMIQFFARIFRDNHLPVWLYTYRILSTSKTTGLIELIPNSSSLDGIKKKSDYPGSLRAWYEQSFGGVGSPKFNEAMENYVSSMAAYSVVTYLLAIKDRHNGNIMLDKDGHVIHIDFGFVFGLAPGKAASMEKAPWKLNKEMAEVMGGWGSDLFNQYKQRCIQAFTMARKYAREAIALVDIMQYHSNFPAFRYNPNAVRDFQNRFYLDVPESDIPKTIETLIRRSYGHLGSDFYDSFQLATNGIAK